jgi:hypothetical protein
VLLHDGKVVGQDAAGFSSAFRVVLLEERDRDVKPGPVVLVREAGLG